MKVVESVAIELGLIGHLATIHNEYKLNLE